MREGLIVVVLLSLIIGGVAGGIVGATVSGSLGYFPQYAANKQIQSSPQTKTLKVEEESQTIGTVKKFLRPWFPLSFRLIFPNTISVPCLIFCYWRRQWIYCKRRRNDSYQ